jgi:hypothetical protein
LRKTCDNRPITSLATAGSPVPFSLRFNKATNLGFLERYSDAAKLLPAVRRGWIWGRAGARTGVFRVDRRMDGGRAEAMS